MCLDRPRRVSVPLPAPSQRDASRRPLGHRRHARCARGGAQSTASSDSRAYPDVVRPALVGAHLRRVRRHPDLGRRRGTSSSTGAEPTTSAAAAMARCVATTRSVRSSSWTAARTSTAARRRERPRGRSPMSHDVVLEPLRGRRAFDGGDARRERSRAGRVLPGHRSQRARRAARASPAGCATRADGTVEAVLEGDAASRSSGVDRALPGGPAGGRGRRGRGLRRAGGGAARSSDDR